MTSYMICDLQWGSTGKGALAYWLAKHRGITLAISANMPNAGHTARDGQRKWVHTALPVALAADSCHFALLGPGSVFDPDAIVREVIDGGLTNKTIIIHPAAIPLLDRDREAEAGLIGIGSTMKGSAAANIRRMKRDPNAKTIAGQCPAMMIGLRDALHDHKVSVYVDAVYYHEAMLRHRHSTVVEGSQGFGLSVYHGFYPYVTSRDCTPNQLAADCALPSDYRHYINVIGVLRTLPIRVANRFDKTGVMIGTSGPCYPDQQEIDWSDLGMEPELTTVTKLPRRIFTYSHLQIEQAVRMVRPNTAFLNFAQYVDGPQRESITAHLSSLAVQVAYTGWGPDDGSIVEHLNGGAHG